MHSISETIFLMNAPAHPSEPRHLRRNYFFLRKQFVFLHALDGFLQKDVYCEVCNNTSHRAFDGNILSDWLIVGF